MKKKIKAILLSLVVLTSCGKDSEKEIVTFIKDFKVNVEEVTDNSAKLKWTNAVSSDNSKVTYSVSVNDSLIKKKIRNNYLFTY